MNDDFMNSFSNLFEHVLNERIEKKDNLKYLIQSTLLEFLNLHGKKTTELTGWEVLGYMLNDYIEYLPNHFITGIAKPINSNTLVFMVIDKNEHVMELSTPVNISIETWKQICDNCLKVYGKDN